MLLHRKGVWKKRLTIGICRGAGSSAGRTSWTAKAELDDYASFVGFLAYYLHFISPTRHTNGDSSDVDSLQQVPTGISPSVPHDAPIFLIGGYSYGSMIASKLTSLRDVLQMFTSPPASSNAAQIRLQAECLAGQQSGLSSCARNALSYRHQPGYCTDTATINGTMRTPEPVLGPQDLRRNSCVGRGKVMPLMDSVDATAAKTGEELRANSFEPNHQVHTPHRAGRRNRSASVMTSKAGRLPAVSDFTIPREAYLLVSPIPGIMTRLTTMSLLPSALTRSQDVSDRDGKIACYPTLAVFGDQDCFVSAAKLRSWAARLKGLPDSKFQAKEVSKAGHFWIEHGAIASLHVLVDEFVKGLTGDMASLDKPR